MSHYSALVIDPNEETLHFLTHDLRDDGYQVTSHHQGLQALTDCQEKHFDLILVERNLNDIDSLQLCRDILATSENSDTVIMILSSWEDQHERAKALDSGAIDYITKPFHYPDLAKRLDIAIRDKETAG